MTENVKESTTDQKPLTRDEMIVYYSRENKLLKLRAEFLECQARCAKAEFEKVQYVVAKAQLLNPERTPEPKPESDGNESTSV